MKKGVLFATAIFFLSSCGGANSEMKKMVDFKVDERLNTLNHSCAHVMAQAVKHL